MAIAERGVGCGSLPVLVLNTAGYYDGIIEQMRRAFADGMLRHQVTDYFTVVEEPSDAIAWCLKQQRRATPPRKPADGGAYRAGVLHGALAALAASVAVLGWMRARS